MEGESSLTARFEATDEESLERLTGYVHDAWFDVDQITQEDDVVSIPIALRGVRVKKRFLPEHTKPPGSYESSLVIRAVMDFEIDEPEQIGVYGINYFTFDPPRLTIVAGPNCTVTLEVDELNVEAELRMRPLRVERSGRDRARRSHPRGRAGDRRAPPRAHAERPGGDARARHAAGAVHPCEPPRHPRPASAE